MYTQPDRVYDETLIADEAYIATLPDLQNGESSFIQGSHRAIEKVGIHNFRLPLHRKTKDGKTILLETSITGTVSLEAEKKGINMSRIMRRFYSYKEEEFSMELLHKILLDYKESL